MLVVDEAKAIWRENVTAISHTAARAFLALSDGFLDAGWDGAAFRAVSHHVLSRGKGP